MAKEKNENFNIADKALNFILKDILKQIKVISKDQKDAPYTKLIELFFKGVDLNEKISGSSKKLPENPEINFISDLNQDNI